MAAERGRGRRVGADSGVGLGAGASARAWRRFMEWLLRKESVR